ncbi:MAG: endonuclease [Turneriella sp.]|nr:endonuclease [Turneriella sp.]
MKFRISFLAVIRFSILSIVFVGATNACLNQTNGYQGTADLAATYTNGSYETSSDFRGYWIGIDTGKANDAFKAVLQARIRNHRQVPYTNNSTTPTDPTNYNRAYMLLTNPQFVVPDKFDVWDAFIILAYRNANPYSTGGNCASGKLLDWYDYRCYDTPADIFTDNGGQQGSTGSDSLGAPAANFGNQGIYNREHSWPKSWFLAAAASGYCASDKDSITGAGTSPYDYRAYVDLHHLIPARAAVNTSRSNNAFGIVDVPSANYPRTNGAKSGTPKTADMSGFPTVTDSYTSTVFEPANEVKGALARIYFYMATRYYTEDDCWLSNKAVTGANINPWLEDMLRTWHNTYPVSDGERLKNDWIQRIQGNRNPFIDHPEWVAKINDF